MCQKMPSFGHSLHRINRLINAGIDFNKSKMNHQWFWRHFATFTLFFSKNIKITVWAPKTGPVIIRYLYLTLIGKSWKTHPKFFSSEISVFGGVIQADF